MCVLERGVCIRERGVCIRERCVYWREVCVLERGACIREVYVLEREVCVLENNFFCFSDWMRRYSGWQSLNNTAQKLMVSMLCWMKLKRSWSPVRNQPATRQRETSKPRSLTWVSAIELSSRNSFGFVHLINLSYVQKFTKEKPANDKRVDTVIESGNKLADAPGVPVDKTDEIKEETKIMGDTWRIIVLKVEELQKM